MSEPEVFDLDAVYAEQRHLPFKFRWAGRDWELPHLAELDYRIQGEIESTEAWTLPAMLDLFRRMFGTEQVQAWDEVEVPGRVIGKLFDQWLTHSGAKPGESQGSDGSSTSSEPKSKPTSTGGTRSASPKRSTPRTRRSGTQPASS